jgi:hypothetical protein
VSEVGLEMPVMDDEQAAQVTGGRFRKSRAKQHSSGDGSFASSGSLLGKFVAIKSSF